MNCDEVRQHWELYYDSEGDSQLYLQINEHLAACQGCAKWFFQQAQFEDAVTARLAAAEPTAELWQRILSETRVARPAAARGWSFFSPFLALAASLLLVVGLWQFAPQRPPEHLSELTAVVHQQLAGESEPLEFNSRSDAAVEAYLKQRVSFPVRCPPRKDAGFEVRGGGVCTIAGDPAAYVVGRVENKDVSIFILPAERLAQFVHERDVLAREAVHHCREGNYKMVLAKVDRNIVVVIGQGSPEQLERVVRAYGSYPEAPAADAA
jgi:anti-sigma factor RsiW